MEDSTITPALLLGLTACMGVLPAVLVAWRFPTARPGLLFWTTWGGGAAGLGAMVSVRLEGGEQPALWLAAGACWLLLGLLALLRPAGLRRWRLLLPLALLLTLGALAVDLLAPSPKESAGRISAMDAAAALS